MTMMRRIASLALVAALLGAAPAGAQYNSANTYNSRAAASLSLTGGTLAGPLTLVPTGGLFNTYDGTPQFLIGYMPTATEYWNASGGLTGMGATLYATNGSTGNVDGNYVTQGTGGHYFGSGSGTLFSILDPGGLPATNNLSITPAVSGTNPLLSSPANTQIDAATGAGNATGYGVIASYNGVIQAKFAPIGSGTPSGAYVRLGGSSADTLAHINCLGDTNTNCFIQASGNGSIIIANSAGNLANYRNSDANTVADHFDFQAASTTIPLRITGVASADISIGGANIGATATKGFIAIPYGAGLPTGVPDITGGGKQMYFDTTNLKLCIYTGAWKCSGAFS